MLRHVVSRVARQVRAHDWNPAPARTRAPSPGWGLFWKISRVCERSHLTLPPNLHVPIAPQARAPVYQSVSVRAMADSAVSADDTSAAWAKVKASIASEDGLRNIAHLQKSMNEVRDEVGRDAKVSDAFIVDTVIAPFEQTRLAGGGGARRTPRREISARHPRVEPAPRHPADPHPQNIPPHTVS